MQTPQVFRYGDISKALGETEMSYVDDLEAIEALGKTVALITGSERLRKVTYEEDFEIMERLLSPTEPRLISRAPRMGTGYDVHQFGPGDHITLCGIKIPHTHGLIGHSDADIGWHALTDAILGAIAMGDIGDHFPPSDPQWKGADSGRFLAHAQHLAKTSGFAISNVDITLICEAPKIKPYREAMRERTANLLDIPLSSVSVKATTTEGLGFTGKREGMAGQAAAVLVPL
jgi:2-C-methyl-D-erythritol 4-phosphate cytidylyltransferase/2-C-methyl-D-erythritol 2,4-cyclodiphosphate synthase